MKKRKNYKQWVHFQDHEFDLSKPGFAEDSQTTICGKTARRIIATRDKDAVTCRRCIEKLKETEWWCPNHGFIPGESVTFEEVCDICGQDVV